MENRLGKGSGATLNVQYSEGTIDIASYNALYLPRELDIKRSKKTVEILDNVIVDFDRENNAIEIEFISVPITESKLKKISELLRLELDPKDFKPIL